MIAANYPNSIVEEVSEQGGVLVLDDAGQPAVAVPQAEALEVIEPVTLLAGERIGEVRIVGMSDNTIELRTPGELGRVVGLLGTVAIGWCLVAWVLYVKSGFRAERLPVCLTLTVSAIISAVLMISSMAIDWVFDGRTQRISRHVGPFAQTHSASEVVGLKLESKVVGVAPFTEYMLLMNVVNSAGETLYEIEEWNRREVDRVKIEALMAAIRKVMGWSEKSE